ncbi:MAG: hypothetical protein LQ344_001066 [Seirophora lacunosa]|nr:MAG: hypothetical protein LQ344_001066 [Seirophora lacunosa]
MPIDQVGQNENRQLQNIANILASSKRVVVITGAGISTNSGIPDFRSEDGLYSLIQSKYTQTTETLHRPSEASSPQHEAQAISRKPQSQAQRLRTNVKGKDLFDSRIWKDPQSTSVFYTFIASLRKKIRDEVKQTTPTHRFIRTIRDSHRLVRCYTQNIDGLESRLGLCMDLERGRGNRARFAAKSKNAPSVPGRRAVGGDMDGGCEVVPLHGDLDVLRCTLCQQTCAWDEQGREGALRRGVAPDCFACAVSDQQRRDRGKRGTKIGSLRPNIVLYGEEHPAADAVGSITTHDLSLAPDVLLILGTSLHVQGVKTLVKEFARCVHARPKAKGKVIFVNLSKPSESTWSDSIDYWVSMDCDAWIDTLRRHRPDIWQIQAELKARIIKKDRPRSTKASALPGEKVGPFLKKIGTARAGTSIPTPVKRSPGRPKSRPLAEINSNEARRTRGQPHRADFSVDLGKDLSSSQLQTPPPSSHKHSAGVLDTRTGPTLENISDPVTPAKKLRPSTQSKHLDVSMKRPRSPETTMEQYLSSKRRRLGFEIWED